MIQSHPKKTQVVPMMMDAIAVAAKMRRPPMKSAPLTTRAPTSLRLIVSLQITKVDSRCVIRLVRFNIRLRI